MNIISKGTFNSNIQILEILGELTGRGAIEIQEYLFASLDEGKCYQIINLKHVKKIDGLGIDILLKFVNRDMMIRLFNVRTEIRGMLRLSGKEDVIKTYNETDCDKVVSIFEKEILKKKDKANHGIRGRRHKRINTSFPKEFKYHSASPNGEIEGRAHVINLSEGGLLANRIIAFNLKTGKIVNEPEITGCDIHDIKFELNGTSKLIETKGKCIWQTRKDSNICAGIRFKNIGKVYKDMIRKHVYEVLQNENN